MISGPTGSGKTTIANIMRQALEASGVEVEIDRRLRSDTYPQHRDGRALAGLINHGVAVKLTEQHASYQKGLDHGGSGELRDCDA